MFFERSLALPDCPYSKNGMIPTEENERTQRKICSNATLSTINFTRTVLASNTDLKTDINLNTEYSFGTRAINTLHLSDNKTRRGAFA